MAFSEQRVLYEWQLEFGQRLSPILKDLGCRRIDRVERSGTDPDLPHKWRFAYKFADKRKRTDITFQNIDYTGTREEPGETITYKLPTRDGGWRREYPPSKIDVEETITREVELVEETTSDYTSMASFEVTNRVHAKASGGVDGIAEAEVETETTTTAKASFGLSGGTRKISKRSETASTKIVVPAGQHLTATVDIGRAKEVTPILEVAYIEAEMRIDLYNWAGNEAPFLKGGKHWNVIQCSSFQDLLWFLEGERVVEYPGMRDFLKKCSKASRQSYKWLLDRKNRRVELERQVVRIYESDSRIQIR